MTSVDTYTYTRCIKHDKKGEEFSDARPNCMDAAATAKRPATCTEFKVWPAPSLGTAWKVVFFFYHACTSLPDRVCLYVCVCLCLLLLLFFFKCTTDRKPKLDPVVLGSERETKTQLSSYQTERGMVHRNQQPLLKSISPQCIPIYMNERDKNAPLKSRL